VGHERHEVALPHPARERHADDGEHRRTKVEQELRTDRRDRPSLAAEPALGRELREIDPADGPAGGVEQAQTPVLIITCLTNV
jgi:hypothetical protein